MGVLNALRDYTPFFSALLKKKVASANIVLTLQRSDSFYLKKKNKSRVLRCLWIGSTVPKRS